MTKEVIRRTRDNVYLHKDSPRLLRGSYLHEKFGEEAARVPPVHDLFYAP